jgi:hypothetical protein
MMNNRQLITVLLICVIGAATLGYIFAVVMIPIVSSLPPPDYPQIILDPEFITAVMTIKMMISFVNMALILLTLGIYVQIYRAIKSKFTLSLITMILLLLMNALTSNPLLLFRFGFQASGVGGFAILPDIFTTIALLVLFYLSLE